MVFSLLVYLAIATGCAPASSPLTNHALEKKTKQPVLAIQHVTVIPMTPPGEVRPNVTVIISNGRIASLKGPIPAEAEIIDGSGKWLMPGLMDMHVHVPTDIHFGPTRPTQAATLFFAYQLVDLRSFPYQTFLQSSHSEEVLLAILADFKGESGDLVAEKIIAKLGELSKRKLELSQRALQLIRLAVLRNLDKTFFNAAKKMAITIDVKKDTLYQLGMEETALNMLREGFTEEVVARLTELSLERIAQLKRELEASRKNDFPGRKL